MLAQLFKHGEAIELGQPQIQDQQTEDIVLQRLIGCNAVGGQIDRVARLRQCKAQGF